MANAHLTVTREKDIVLDDLYSFGEKISIPLDEKNFARRERSTLLFKVSKFDKSYEQALERIPILEEKGQIISKFARRVTIDRYNGHVKKLEKRT